LVDAINKNDMVLVVPAGTGKTIPAFYGYQGKRKQVKRIIKACC
jgi:phosphate starvation-inducible protein PhoH